MRSRPGFNWLLLTFFFFLQKKIQDKCQITAWASLVDSSVYTTNKELKGAPTEHCLCLVSDIDLAKRYVACTSKTLLSYWMCAMRLSKVSVRRTFFSTYTRCCRFQFLFNTPLLLYMNHTPDVLCLLCHLVRQATERQLPFVR